MQIRLQRILAAAGIASRRDAERIIAAGRVSVNGHIVTELGSKADPDEDRVLVDGKSIEPHREKVVLLLHKPPLVMTTKSDPQGRTTVMDLLPDGMQHLNPVGRLDYETGGLLVMSNDGDLAERLTHPRHHVPKVYHALVMGKPTLESLRLLAEGIRLEEGITAPARVQRLGDMSDDTWVELVLTQGWNQQVRRMFKAIGHPVRALRRVALGPLRLGKLAAGEFRVLTQREVEQLRASAKPIDTSAPGPRNVPKPLATDRPPIPPRRKPRPNTH